MGFMWLLDVFGAMQLTVEFCRNLLCASLDPGVGLGVVGQSADAHCDCKQHYFALRNLYEGDVASCKNLLRVCGENAAVAFDLMDGRFCELASQLIQSQRTQSQILSRWIASSILFCERLPDLL